ncbi:hypothetical protein GCM10009843_09280 [Nocardioides bigeumensis]|uniref:Uncharacterized protein n=1 Tax=Nocardioides bigeumensis TaxID=433657 RepID=A0ABN2XZ42_9ACTN
MVTVASLWFIGIRSNRTDRANVPGRRLLGARVWPYLLSDVFIPPHSSFPAGDHPTRGAVEPWRDRDLERLSEDVLLGDTETVGVRIGLRSQVR